jgi:hypothetical protein
MAGTATAVAAREGWLRYAWWSEGLKRRSEAEGDLEWQKCSARVCEDFKGVWTTSNRQEITFNQQFLLARFFSHDVV